MSANFAVLRSKKFTFAKLEIGTWEYRSHIDSGDVEVFKGTKDEVDAWKSKGQLFKERNGFSKTRAGLLKKYETDDTGYRLIMKENRKKQRSLEKAKKDSAKAGRKAKSTTVKGSK